MYLNKFEFLKYNVSTMFLQTTFLERCRKYVSTKLNTSIPTKFRHGKCLVPIGEFILIT